MFDFKMKKNGFTLAETIIVCSLFAVMVIGVIFGINRAFVFLNNTRLQVMATNFAREGVEMVYNIRDTNWRIYPGDKNQHWMDSGTGENRLLKGVYVIKEGNKGLTGDSYIYAEGLSVSDFDSFYDLDGFFDDSNSSNKEKSRLIFTGSYSYNSGGIISTGDLNELMNGFGTNFYRILRVYGVYKKDESESDRELNSSDLALTDGTPVELRFCVKVFYEGSTGKHAKELCSIMTNFME